MSFGLTFDKLLIIGIIAVFLIGPERLPGYAAQLARLVRAMRDMANGAKERMRDEMGPEFDDIEWSKLDPRQYDPRRIIREALLEDGTSASTVASAASTAAAGASGAAGTGGGGVPPRRRYIESAYDQRQRKMGKGRPSPYDDEAT